MTKRKNILSNFEEYFNDNLKNKLDEIIEKSYEIESIINSYQESFINYCSEYIAFNFNNIDINRESDERKIEEIDNIFMQLRYRAAELDKITFKLT